MLFCEHHPTTILSSESDTGADCLGVSTCGVNMLVVSQLPFRTPWYGFALSPDAPPCFGVFKDYLQTIVAQHRSRIVAVGATRTKHQLLALKIEEKKQDSFCVEYLYVAIVLDIDLVAS